MTALYMTGAEIDVLMEAHFPESQRFGVVLEELSVGHLRMRLPASSTVLRPGGTVSGPTLMKLADISFYYLVLAMVGPEPLAVTTHLSIDFLRRPKPADVIANAEMLKLGRRLAVGRVAMASAGDERPVAHASLTYSIPPRDPGH